MKDHIGVALMDNFPSFTEKGFDINEYNKRFYQANVIIKAVSDNVSYPDHWGGLSVKCAFNGTEYYRSNNSFYGVDDDCYLIFNQGKVYSSYIKSDKPVESFTLNFAPDFEKLGVSSFVSKHEKNLDDPFFEIANSLHFTERLFHHDGVVTPVIKRIKSLSEDFRLNANRINEEMILLLGALITNQVTVNKIVSRLPSTKQSTRIEMYRRLSRAKDFLYSSFDKNVSLQQVAEIACLNQFYLLREFKKVFGITPHQYLTQRRLNNAVKLLEQTDKPISEICVDCGFSDHVSFTKLFKRMFNAPPSIYRLGSGRMARQKTTTF